MAGEYSPPLRRRGIHYLLPILRPTAIDKFNYGLVHHKRCRVSFFPGGVDADGTAIDRTGTDEGLFAEHHVAGGIKASEDSPLKVFLIINNHIGADRHHKPYTQIRLDDALKDLPRVLPDNDYQKTAIQELALLNTLIVRARIDVDGGGRLVHDIAGGIDNELAADVHLERREVERVERSNRQQPHMIFRIESMPHLPKNRWKMICGLMGADHDQNLG